jgi:inositol transport system substrate-binding protein
MKKRRVIVACFLALGMFLTGCGTSSAPDAPSADAPEGTVEAIRIGFINFDNSNEFATILANGVKKAEEELGDAVEITYVDGKGDPLAQIAAVEQFIAQQVDVIVIDPIEMKACTPAIEMCNEAGIPVINLNGKTDGGEYTYVGSDDYQGGMMQGEWAAENCPQGTKYVMAMAPMGFGAQVLRQQGFHDVIDEKRPDMISLSEQSGSGDRAKGMALCEDWLQSFPDFTLFVSHGDQMALGAIQAINDAGRNDGSIQIIGFDGTEDGLVAIENGDMTVTLFQNGEEQAYQAMKRAVDIVNGVEGAEEDLLIPFEYIDKDNWQEYSK